MLLQYSCVDFMISVDGLGCTFLIACHCNVMSSFYFKGYIRLGSHLGAYGEIECQGNESKLEECVVRKEIRPTCQRVAVATHCSTSKICPMRHNCYKHIQQ